MMADLVQEEGHLSNPLTIDERLYVGRLIGHDLDSCSMDIAHYLLALKRVNSTEEKDELCKKIGALNFHVQQTHKAFHFLQVLDTYFLQESSIGSYNLMFDYISRLLQKDNCSIDVTLDDNEGVTEDRPLLSFQPLVYSMVYNLVKNAVRENDKENGHVNIDISQSNGGKLKNCVYSHNGSDSATLCDFIFSVHDDGPGFSDKVPIEQYFDKGFTTDHSGSGFGLYYATLIAKALRGHITVESELGNTTISFFHPDYIF